MDNIGLEVRVRARRNRAIVRLNGELDLAGAPRLAAAISGCFPDGQPGTDVMVDVRGLRFIDCAGVRVLVAAARSAAGRSQTFRVRDAGAQVEDVLRLLGVDELLGLPPPWPAPADARSRVAPTVSDTP